MRDVNSHMRQRQEMERLRTIIARIDSYEPIVSIVDILSENTDGKRVKELH